MKSMTIKRFPRWAFLTGILMVSAFLHSKAAVLDWGRAEWIGFTQDDRPAEWSARDTVFNRPPADIATWKPKPKELQAKRRASYPAPLLRKTFLVGKPVQSARVLVCGLGLHELHLNGRKVGDRVLDPAQTSYDKRAFFVVHDVTHLLLPGTNG